MKHFLYASVLAASLPAHAQQDILTTAASNGSFDTLVSLVVAADLDEVLQGEGSFTVFAPTDDAFAMLPAETVESLRDPANRDQLRAILTYHVVGSEISVPLHPPSHRITEAETLQGNEIRFERENTRVFVNDAEIVVRNVHCANGLVHAIDSVLLPPPSTPDLAELAAGAGTFTTLLAAVEAAGLGGVLEGEEALTVLAPTDEAFAALPNGALDELLLPENRETLARILKDHVLAGDLSARDLARREAVSALSGSELPVAIEGGGLEIGGARVLQNDLEASNGSIHVIDRVLLIDPPASARPAADDANWPAVIEISAGWDDHLHQDGVRARRLVLRAAGGGSIDLTGVEAHEIETHIGGGARISLAGAASRHGATVGGGATLDALSLETAETELSVAGGGSATVLANERLEFGANGGATVTYVDTGAHVESRANQYANIVVLDGGSAHRVHR